MTSNRVERLQMRQRGAGTRKIKEVDFGFSLGFEAPAEESSQPASQPTNNDLKPAPAPQPPLLDALALAPAPSTTDAIQTQSTPSPTRSNAFGASRDQLVRTPGSARNKLPPRRSTFEIPADDEPELERSNKRRRIETPKDNAPPSGAQTEPPNDAPQNDTAETSVQALSEGQAIPIRSITSNQAPLPDQETAAESRSIPAIGTDTNPPEALNEGLEHPETKDTARPESLRVNGTASPSDSSERRRRGKKGRPSPSQDNVSNLKATEAVYQQAVPDQLTDSLFEPAEAAQETEAQGLEATRTQDKQTRSRTLESIQPSAEPPVTDRATAEKSISETIPSDNAGKSVRGRRRKNLKPTDEAAVTGRDTDEPSATQVEDEVAADNVAIRENFDLPENQRNGVDQGKKRAGRPKKLARSPPPSEDPAMGRRKRQHEEDHDRAETSPEQEHPAADTARAGKRRKQRKEPESSQIQEGQDGPRPEPEVEESRDGKRRRGREERDPTPQAERTEPDTAMKAARAGRKKQQRQERSPQQEQLAPGPEAGQARVGRGIKRPEKQVPAARQEVQLEAEPETERVHADKGKKRQERAPTAEQEEEPEPEPEPETEREPQPGRRPKDTKRGGKRPAHPDESPREDGTEDQPQPKTRRPRQPRGETVPVTVHRLANAASLGGELFESSDEDDSNSPDEVTNKQTTGLPSRGGVNPADVLAQICRETLEKTLTTLKTGIENEANATRRAEWTLRRKAVEAYGAELEGRLSDLSEMLDSNFMLSAKVKKAKRNMLDLRARLDHIRREREAVALRLDAVRREHAREEQAGMARSTINHSLHNLDLALERGQNRTSSTRDESPTAGLELRLRSLARSVSSSAPGSQGGILSQIKSFNAQLEATARRLEG